MQCPVHGHATGATNVARYLVIDVRGGGVSLSPGKHGRLSSITLEVTEPINVQPEQIEFPKAVA